MTVKELREALANVPDDTLVELRTWDDGCQGGEYCGEYAQYDYVDVGSIDYDSTTKKVTLREGL